jgi:hypothetical protein
VKYVVGFVSVVFHLVVWAQTVCVYECIKKVRVKKILSQSRKKKKKILMGRQVLLLLSPPFAFLIRKGGTPFPISIHPSFPYPFIFTHFILLPIFHSKEAEEEF